MLNLRVCSIAHPTTSSVLERLTSFPAINNFSAQDPDRTRSPSTRKQALEIIQRWIDNPSAERFLWLHGPAGTGRSAMAQTVANANSQDKVVATFFFSRSDPSCNDGNRLITTLAWQLANSIPALNDHIFHSLNEHPDLLRRGVETQFEKLIVRPFLALNKQQAPVVIIDSIDECLDEKLQRRILKVIGTAVRNTDFPLRFLISSKPEAHIEENINRFYFPILRIDLVGPYDANSAVKQYFRTEFARIAAKEGLELTWPGQRKIKRLVRRSSGQLLYAAVVIGLIDDEDNDAQTQLDIILGLKPPRTMSPFAELDRLYLEILKRVPDQDFLKTFLGLLVGRWSVSRDNLSDDDAMLMGISESGLGERLREMRSILKFEPYVDVYHPFLEFLQDSSRSFQYHVSKRAGTRRYLRLVTSVLIVRAARLTRQPDFHGVDHFAPEFGKLMKRNPQAIELEVEDWEKILRPLLKVLDKLLKSSNIDSLKDGYCQQCRFFLITYDALTHFKSLQGREVPDVEKYLKSLKEIIWYRDRRQQKSKFGRIFSGLGAKSRP